MCHLLISPMLPLPLRDLKSLLVSLQLMLNIHLQLMFCDNQELKYSFSVISCVTSLTSCINIQFNYTREEWRMTLKSQAVPLLPSAMSTREWMSSARLLMLNTSHRNSKILSFITISLSAAVFQGKYKYFPCTGEIGIY